jgi:uncharacterized protein YcbK (DUF882 family)
MADEVSDGRRRLLLGLPAFALGMALGPRTTLAGPTDERRLSFLHTHTGGRLEVAFGADGRYLPEGLSRVDDFLKDYLTGERHVIDPRLLDLLHDLSLLTGTRAPFAVISGYRSPQTNAMLHARSGGVARGSLHVQGQAIDIRLADVRTAVLRDAALELRRGGVGFYPGSDFVHVDTGRVRSWS